MRVPSLSTIRELRKEDSAMPVAMAANRMGNRRGAPKISLKICCAELRNPNSAPITSIAPNI